MGTWRDRSPPLLAVELVCRRGVNGRRIQLKVEPISWMRRRWKRGFFLDMRSVQLSEYAHGHRGGMARPRIFRTAVFRHLDHKLKLSLIVIRTLRALPHQRQHSLLHVLLVLGASLTLQVSGGFLKNPSGAGFGGSDLSGPGLVLIEINLRGPRLLVPAVADPFKGAVCHYRIF
jgi:hypothetical protein